MRIIVYNTAASSGGALMILKSFYHYIANDENEKENEWIFILSDKYIEETDNIKLIIFDEPKKGWTSRLKFDLFYGKRVIANLEPDILVSLQNTIIFGVKEKQVLYVHQAIPFQTEKRFSFFKKDEGIFAVYQFLIGSLIKRSIKHADYIVVQTKWMKEEIIQVTGIRPEKILSVLPPSENISIKGNYVKLKKNNFFYPAADSYYKNHRCIYEACALVDESGVFDYNISLTIEQGPRERNISYLGQIPHKDVLKNYSESTLIFPSFIETVGLPLLEAKQLGSLILAADCLYSREVLDGYNNAYFFNPFRPKELADLMKKIMSEEIIRQEKNQEDIEGENGWGEIVEFIKFSN